MDKKTKCIWIDSRTIKDFLIAKGKGPYSKDYEFMVALLLNRFCEIQWQTDCRIGFEIEEKYERMIPDQGVDNINQLEDILRNKTKENSDIDIVIGYRDKHIKGIRGTPFQLKRFGFGLERKDTKALIEFLEKYSKKYVKNKITLVIFAESGEKNSLKFIKQSIDFDTFPFKRLMFIWMEDKKIINIGELWPQSGMDSFLVDKLLD